MLDEHYVFLKEKMEEKYSKITDALRFFDKERVNLLFH